MTNVYVLSDKYTSENEKTINKIIPWILETDYNIFERKQVITGNLIDDTSLLFDRFSKDVNAWLILLTDETIRICTPEKNKELCSFLKDHPNKSAIELLSSNGTNL